MLKFGEPNPLSIFGMRRIDHCPPHFSSLNFTLRTKEKNISDWIWENTSGRFYLGDSYYVNDRQRIEMSKVVAFELPAEASYFTLMLDTINLESNW
jgi:hypothetical protein